MSFWGTEMTDNVVFLGRTVSPRRFLKSALSALLTYYNSSLAINWKMFYLWLLCIMDYIILHNSCFGSFSQLTVMPVVSTSSFLVQGKCPNQILISCTGLFFLKSNTGFNPHSSQFHAVPYNVLRCSLCSLQVQKCLHFQPKHICVFSFCLHITPEILVL